MIKFHNTSKGWRFLWKTEDHLENESWKANESNCDFHPYFGVFLIKPCFHLLITVATPREVGENDETEEKTEEEWNLEFLSFNRVIKLNEGVFFPRIVSAAPASMFGQLFPGESPWRKCVILGLHLKTLSQRWSGKRLVMAAVSCSALKITLEKIIPHNFLCTKNIFSGAKINKETTH